MRRWLKEPNGRLVMAAALWALFCLTSLPLEQGAWLNRGWIADITYIPLSSATLALAWRASRHAGLDARARLAWGVLAGGFALQLTADLLWFLAGFAPRITPPERFASAIYLTYFIPLIAGMLLLPAALPPRRERPTAVMDALSTAVGGGAFVWYFVVRYRLAVPPENPVELGFAIGFSAADVLVLLTVAAVLLRRPAEPIRRPLQLLVVGALGALAGDVIYGYGRQTGTFHSGGAADALWIASRLVMVLAAWQQVEAAGRPAPARRQPGGTMVLSYLPYAAVALTCSLLVAVTLPQWTGTIGPLVLVVVTLTALVLARQIASVRENLRLTVEGAARESEARFASLVRHSSDVITVLDVEGAILYQSPSSVRVFGHAPAALAGRPLPDLAHTSDREALRDFLASAVEQEGTTAPIEWRLRKPNGRWIHVESIGANQLADPAVRGVILNTRDVSERHELQERLTFQAFHDSLTGLANRALLRNRVEHALSRAARTGGDATVLFVDLDNFKSVNDSYGHAEGDRILRLIADRLRVTLRTVDTVARLGGDEFAILLEDTDVENGVREVAERVLAALREPVRLRGTELILGGSIGVCTAKVGDTVEELLRNADLAMYIAKGAGRNRYELYQPHMHAAVRARVELEADLQHALERDELEVFFQPIVELRTRRIVGAEALLRWNHPTRGSVPPLEFIPVAEDSGLILPIGRWVLERACAQAESLRRTLGLGRDFRLTVNISGRQLQDGRLGDEVTAALDASGFAPDSLVLEITEGIFMRDTLELMENLAALKERGVRLAIDDFGTGYSSLGYLHRFPVDILKIDRSFVSRLGSSSSDGLLARSIISLGETLHLSTVAEGIEEAREMEALLELGCEFGQGYLFGRPVPAREAERSWGGSVAAGEPLLRAAAV